MALSSKGVLLINLGTPDHPTPPAVKKYLTQFLSDKRVIDLPAPIRWILLHLLILPLRTKQSSHAYQSIWTEKGSPLLIHSQALQTALAGALGNEYCVALGMRYGNPSIASALEKLNTCETLHILPLFPQYSSAATGSAIEKVLSLIARQVNIPSILLKHDFYRDPGFISAYASILEKTLQTAQPDIVLFSYHGLPERHIKKQCQTPCSSDTICPIITEKNHYCYRAQCYETSRLLAEALKLSKDQYIVAFQSRLGKTPWIKPYTDYILKKLADKNIKNLVIACPSFVADCLETLEEIGIRAKKQWQDLGGRELTLSPCLNADGTWIEAIVKMLKENK